MTRKLHISLVALGAALGASLMSTDGYAGGFHVREQSTTHQGASFAGNAAGGSLSAMFWNSAAAAMAPAGIYTESHFAAIIGNSQMTGDLFACGGAVDPATKACPAGPNLGLPRDSGNIADPAVVPASYMSYRISPQLVAAIAITSPFGLVTEPQNRFWAGQTFARTSEIKTYNFNPTLAYQINPQLAVGVGLVIERMEGRLKSASGIGVTSPNLAVQGDDTSFGYTLGVMWQPAKGTSVGLGFRSKVDHTLEGTIRIPGSAILPASQGAAITAGTSLPEIVTLSIRHAVNPQWTLLGTIEWTNWSRAQKLDIICGPVQGSNPVFCPAGSGQLVRSLDLGWHDGWFFSVGAEHAYSPTWTFRGGVAYEISPIQNPNERTLRVPDADRIWVSIGASYRWSATTTLDFAYSHIFVGDAPIDRTEGGVRFIGSADTHVDIISVALRMQLGSH